MNHEHFLAKGQVFQIHGPLLGSEVPASSVLLSSKEINTLYASFQSKGETQHGLRKELLCKRN